jgi:hypothetical protein
LGDVVQCLPNLPGGVSEDIRLLVRWVLFDFQTRKHQLIGGRIKVDPHM